MNIEPSRGQSSTSDNAYNSQSAISETTTSTTNPTEKNAQECLELVRFALNDVKAQNIVELDVRGVSNFADMIVIASGTSTRHVKALADNVAVEAKKHGYRPVGIEGERDAEWILIDLSFVVVHVMLPTARKFYDLESLWQPVEQK
jgi:ribosome-associated protein